MEPWWDCQHDWFPSVAWRADIQRRRTSRALGLEKELSWETGWHFEQWNKWTFPSGRCFPEQKINDAQDQRSKWSGSASTKLLRFPASSILPTRCLPFLWPEQVGRDSLSIRGEGFLPALEGLRWAQNHPAGWKRGVSCGSGGLDGRDRGTVAG